MDFSAIMAMASYMVASGSMDQSLQPLFFRMEAIVSDIAFTSRFQTALIFQIMSRLSSPIDRKSTRLNSSHLVISYAVFCLKKKNITTNVLPPLSLLRCDYSHLCVFR